MLSIFCYHSTCGNKVLFCTNSTMLVTFLLSICFALAQTRNSLLVKLPQLGHLEGYYEESLNGNVYFAFEGVPYARPPIGKYRFEESEPPKPWNGVYQAKTAYLCMQRLQYSKHSKDDVVGKFLSWNIILESISLY